MNRLTVVSIVSGLDNLTLGTLFLAARMLSRPYQIDEIFHLLIGEDDRFVRRKSS